MKGISPKQEVKREEWPIHLANKIKYHWRPLLSEPAGGIEGGNTYSDGGWLANKVKYHWRPLLSECTAARWQRV